MLNIGSGIKSRTYSLHMATNVKKVEYWGRDMLAMMNEHYGCE